MDRLLEALQSVYEGMEEEEQMLREIEDELLKPLDANDAEEPETPEVADPATQAATKKPIAPPQAAAPAPVKAPPKAPEPATPPVDKTILAPTPSPEEPAKTLPAAPELPPIDSTVPTPPPATEIPPKPEEPVRKKIGSTDFKKYVTDKLKKYKKEKKVYRAKLKKSTALRYISYNPSTKDLVVTFRKNNRSYKYANVDSKRAVELLSSMHKGTLFNRTIKPNSPYKELT
jgi:hypothetical protein